MPFPMPFRQKDEKPGREGELMELRFPEVSNDTPLVEGTPLVKDTPLVVKERQNHIWWEVKLQLRINAIVQGVIIQCYSYEIGR
jgi:hypothetical protein